MSGPNAAMTLPPGDRDDAPSLPLDPQAPPDRRIGMSLEIEAIGKILDEIEQAYLELQRAPAERAFGVIHSASLRLSALGGHLAKAAERKK